MLDSDQILVFVEFINSGTDLLAIYISIVSAYLVAAYFVGSNLTKSQVVIVTSFFVITAFLCSFGGFAMFSGAQELERSFTSERDFLYWATYLFFFVQLLGIGAAMKFMFDIRKKRGA